MDTPYIIRSIVLILTLSVGSFSVIAADEAEQKFEYLDSDGNGFISRSEATSDPKLRESWNNVDKNKDGKLTEKEFMAFIKIPDQPFPDQ